jgi:hypothetical protein
VGKQGVRFEHWGEIVLYPATDMGESCVLRLAPLDAHLEPARLQGDGLAYLKQVVSAAMVLLAAGGGYAAYDQLNANRERARGAGEERSRRP